jgi:hypothetical protein
MIKKRLTQNIDDMLDVLYSSSSTDAHLNTIASVNAMFDQINKLGENIRIEKRQREGAVLRQGKGAPQT